MRLLYRLLTSMLSPGFYILLYHQALLDLYITPSEAEVKTPNRSTPTGLNAAKESGSSGNVMLVLVSDS